VTFTSETCSTGLTLFRGSVDKIEPMHLADLMARHAPLHLIVDFRRLPGGLPETIQEPAWLFDWLPPQSAPAASPVLLAADEYPEYGALIQQAWGEDALVCLFSKREKQELRAHLRAEAHVGSDSMLGFCWPSVMGPLLSFFRPQFVEKLLAGVDAVLVEFADLPETWQVFARAPYAEVLTGLGLVPEDETAPTPR
jgi:hypothetical protein